MNSGLVERWVAAPQAAFARVGDRARSIGAGVGTPRPRAVTFEPRYALAVAALVAAYAGAAQLSYAFDFAGPVAAIVWLPVGVGIAFLYLGGLRLFPGVIAGDLLANNYGTLPLGTALLQSVGNVLEVVVAVVIMQRLVRRGSPLDSVANLAALLLAIATGTALSATIGTTANWMGGVVDSDAFGTIWRTWWLGDFIGAIVVVPLVLAWYKRPPAMLSGWRIAEAAVLAVVVVLITGMASRHHEPGIYLVFPALIWAALRFGRRGATLAIAVTVAIVVWNTTHYSGPFAVHPVSDAVLRTQLFIAVVAGSTLVLAAMVSERERFVRDLATRARLEDAAQAERRQLEQNLHDGAQQRLIWLGADLRRAAELAPTEPDRVPPLLARAEADLQLAMDELRDLAHGIHPAVLTELGLRGAVAVMARRSPTPVTIDAVPDGRYPAGIEAAAYYVLAEALANAEKHAKASHIRVAVTAFRGELRVDVYDDGRGGADPNGSGLSGLRDRVEGADGTLAVDSPRGRGTRIVAEIPIPEP
jgi:signal transduction histidine kinase